MSKHHRVLIVDDEPLILSLIEEGLRRHPIDIEIANNGTDAVRMMNRHAFDLIISDVRLPDINGMDLLKETRKLDKAPPVILITGFATVCDAVKAMKYGAYDYITKPLDIDHLDLLIKQVLRNLRSGRFRPRRNEQPLTMPSWVTGSNPRMLEIYELIRQVAPTNSTILLEGESGTGKELVAGMIQSLSLRKDRPYVKLNCAAIPANLIESELFGHEKGAFTGAVARRKGKFFVADTGTILLDEISELDLHLQAKLLRVLQEREFEPVGSDKPRRIDVRVIATSNRSLKAMVQQKTFREDLFYRLNVVPIHIPSLRERKEDIPELVKYFAQNVCAANQRPPVEIAPEVYAFLAEYDWPGNVRELQHAVERAIVTGRSDVLNVENFAFLKFDVPASAPFDPAALVGLTCAEVERMLILETLLHEQGNRTRTAERLGINVRTLRNKLKDIRAEEVEPRYRPLLHGQENAEPSF